MPSTQWLPSVSDVIRLLVVDDCEGDRRLIDEYLTDIEDLKYEVFGVDSLKDAEKALSLYQFDLIVLDYQLGDGCGLDFLREHRDLRHAPTILLTGHRSRELDRIALEAGADDLLYKSELQPSILERSIRYAICRFRAAEMQRMSQVALEEANSELRDAKAQIEVLGANSIKLAGYLASASGHGEELYVDRAADAAEWDKLANSCRLGVWRVSPDGKTVALNAAMASLLGLDESQIMDSGWDFDSFFAERDRERANRELMIWSHGVSSSLEAELAPQADGTAHRVVICGSPLKDEEGAVSAILMSVVDVTERRNAEASIQNMVVTDPLTGVLNRLAFTSYFPKLLANADRTGRLVGVLYVDLDGFKAINDTWGHQAGDEVLKHVSGVIRNCTRKSDLVARLGGDEFVVALTNIDTPANSAHVARNILAGLAKPVAIASKELSIKASIGISIFPNDSSDADILLKYADLALYRRKGAKGAGYNFFDPDMRAQEDRRQKLGSELKLATDHGEFFLAYQPIVGISDGDLMGVEALIRWNHPATGVRMPVDFMEAAEETGQIVEIGQWALSEALSQAQVWSRSLGRPLPVAINLAGRQIKCETLKEEVRKAIERSSCDPHLLEFEIDEAAITHDLSNARRFVEAMRGCGVRVTLDAFGSGGSSLALLKDIPFERIKVSRPLAPDIAWHEAEAAITGAAINLAHTLKIKVTGDGIETRRQLDDLRRMGCDGAQGRFVCPPLEASDLVGWMAHRGPGTAAPTRLPWAS